VSEADILLRDELTALERAHPHALRVVHTLDNPSPGWTGAAGYVSRELVSAHVPPAERGDKIKVLICGASRSPTRFVVRLVWLTLWNIVVTGPPGQVNAVAGKKEGPKQGPVGGILKELGYTEDQVFKF
jgi:cytochrome-b5 reductase